MPPLFNPRLINPPTGDPTLFAPFFFERRALIFDLGDLGSLSPRDLLKITHVFVTHTHMDHFIGFDHLLRILLGRGKTLHLFGPEGFITNVEGKIAGYTWNLVENYENPLTLAVTEVLPDKRITRRFECRNRFFPGRTTETDFSPTLVDMPEFSVETAILDHGIPCLAFAVKERFRINIRKDTLDQMGLPPGPWLHTLKQALFSKMPPDTVITVPGITPQEARRFPLGELEKKLTIITKGEKFVYITDAAFTEENFSRMINLARDADHIFIEASFLEKDHELAGRKRHLTAFQAGMIAASSGARRMTLFHFSPRYEGNFEAFQTEAIAAYRKYSENLD